MSALDFIWDSVFPPKCPFCGEWISRGETICFDCDSKLPRLSGAEAEKAVELTLGCVSPLRYEGVARDGVHAFKFQGKSGRSETLGGLIARCVQEHGLEADMVSWPPLSAKRLKERGYDQSKLLAEAVGVRLRLPIMETLKKQDVPAQSGLEDAAARRANVLGAYTAVKPERFRGKTVLLIDDVVTTGATLSECAKVLKLAGAEAVVCATLTRAR